MSADPVAIESRRRRFEAALTDLEDLVQKTADDSAVPDAVARCLDALYALTELVKPSGRVDDFDSQVTGDPGGETTLALIAARGGQTHRFVDFGDLHTYGSHRYGEGPYGGGWAWQSFHDPNPRFRQRVDWYASHIKGTLVHVPLRTAQRWLDDQLGVLTSGDG